MRAAVNCCCGCSLDRRNGYEVTRLYSIRIPMKASEFWLPVVARELTELAQRKSTYRLRCLGVGLPLFVCVIFLTISKAQADSPLDLIGSGGTLHLVLYITLLCIVYLFAPALSCSAFTAEKEKQTLGLLLISRLSPFSLIVEKVCSRMIPILSLVIGSAPLFGIAFLMGGVTVADTLGAVACLVYVTLQVTVVAVSVSAIMKSSVAAFWVTNFVLAAMYFTAPLLSEMSWLPWQGPSSMSDDWLFLFPPYQFDLLINTFQFGITITTRFDLFWVTVPSLVLTVLILLSGWKALVFFGDVGGIRFQELGRRLLNFNTIPGFSQLANRISHRARGAASENKNSVSNRKNGTSHDLKTGQQTHEQIWGNYEAAYRPLYWRERSTMPFLSWKIWTGALALLSTLFLAVWTNSNGFDQTEEGAAFVLCSLIGVLLIMITLATRIFTRERDQQTLESILVMPLSNCEILAEKSAALNRAVWVLACPLLLFVCQSILTSQTSPHHDSDFIFLVCVMSHTILYLHLVKWISIYFGLRLKTTIKAMVGSLAAVVVLCVGLVAVVVTLMISSDISPDENMFWFYSTPVIVPMLGAFRDLYELYGRNGMPDSALLCLILNLGVYFTLMKAVKNYTIRRLPQLLERYDNDTKLCDHK